MAAKKNATGLGRGLDALFGDVEVTAVREQAARKKGKRAPDTAPAEPAAPENELRYIDINDIKPNAAQPRKNFDEDKLEELAESIDRHGLIQPVVLRSADQGYEIVAGERRWRAARMVGLKEIPCIVKELTDEENMLLSIIENMQREDLNPIEEAEGLKQMIDTYGLTQEQISRGVGKSRPYITNSLRLLKLPEKIRYMTADGSLSVGHARALAAIKDVALQQKLADRAVKEGLSVRQIERLAQETRDRETRKKRRTTKSADEKRVEAELREALGTKVTLQRKGAKGRIEIEFYNGDEMERLIDLLRSLR
ncbi:MAG: ParB/RepB/Spo0J family partition protein [Firmicutes bacterium]|nr:ParB/RepB/Spo0J family partition protein [Bacillota bacterium]